jgi:hypothetical protein
MSVKQFFGKYRGTVLQNVDPMQIGRILAMVPAVSSLLPTTWCLPCYPMANKASGFYCVPQIGAGVWIEFEGGDPDKPIWSGGFYGIVAETPADAKLGNPVSPSIVIASQLLNTIAISDLTTPLGGITLRSTTGAMIVVNDTGIYISNGKGATITMIGPTVNINAGALTIV